MKSPAIIFDGVSKHYPLYHHITGGIKNFIFNLPESLRSLRNTRFDALRDISFEIYRGEAFGIVGDNGSGKSTTLGLIAGVIDPNGGRIEVEGRISPFLELGAGFHPELTGRENVILNGVLLGLTKAEVLERIDEIIEFSELHEFIDQPIRIYSTGMLARLGFSVVAHLDLDILLIDEVLAVGDMAFQKKCVEKMMSFMGKGVTMVFVSHSMEDIEKICDRVLWLENNTVIKVGPTHEVVSEYSLRPARKPKRARKPFQNWK